MDFGRMKRRQLLALCAEHGLAARGSKDDLAASLAGAISEAASATAAAEKAVKVMVVKGCLKQPGSGPSGGSSGAVSKKVTFSFREEEDEAGKPLVAAEVISRRGRQQKCIETGSSGEGIAGELCADAGVIWSRTNAVKVHGGSEIERSDNLVEEEKVAVESTVDKKQRAHKNPKRIAAVSEAGISCRNTRKSILSTADDTSAQSQNDPAEKEGGVIRGADFTESEEDSKQVVVVRKAVDCKQKQKTQQYTKNVAANARAGYSCRSTRKSISSSAAVDTSVQSRNNSAEKGGEVIGGAVRTTKLKRKTTVKLKIVGTLPAAVVSGKGCQHMCTEERGCNPSAEGVTGQFGADARETPSKSNNVGKLCADTGVVESQNIPAEAERDGKVARKAADSRQKQRTLQNAENIAVNAHAGRSPRITRSSSFSADNVLLCPIVEKKRGIRSAELSVDEKSAEVQDLPTAASPVITESKRSQRTKAYCKLAVQKSSKVALSCRNTRSCSVNAAAALPAVVIGSKSKMKTEAVHLERAAAPVVSKSDVPRKRSY